MKGITKIYDEVCEVVWKDARRLTGFSLQQAIEDGLTINHTYGLIVYDGKDNKNNDIVIICTEYNEDEFDHDFVVIPKDWIIEIKKRER